MIYHHGAHHDTPDHRDLLYAEHLFRIERGLIANSSDNSHLLPTERWDQGEAESCGGHAMANLAYMLTGRLMSRNDVYWLARGLRHEQAMDSGMRPRNGFKAWSGRLGVLEEIEWPYDPGRVLVSPPHRLPGLKRILAPGAYYRIDHADPEQLAACLGSGHGIVLVMAVFASDYDAKIGVLNRRPAGNQTGFHCVCLHSHEGNWIQFRNSWGPGWGSNGDGLIHINRIATLCGSGWTVRGPR